jgi:DNA adenine methylase
MTRLPHPIPYQGSKRKLATMIGDYLPKGIATFYEPFAGSAAMTIYAAYHRRAKRFVVADSLEPMVDLLRSIVEEPDRTSARYAAVWRGQRDGEAGYFNEVRDRYNRNRDPVDLLYLICRCVKNAVRFNKDGRFTQSVDKRRLGMRPEKMQAAVLGVSRILRGRTEFRVGDWRETVADAGPGDFVYMDPPYLGTSIGRDKRYHQQLTQEALCEGLEELIRRRVPFALSYDGMTGGREYGPPLPDALGLTRLLLHAGTSSQSTLSGRKEETVESLYVTPGLAEPVAEVIRPRAAQASLAL